MDFFTAFDISASGLSAQRTRLNVISSNLANVNSIDTPEGGPYRRRDVVVSATPVGQPFDSALREKMHEVRVTEIIEDPRPFRTVYDPYHPGADRNGYVHYPNVNVIEEMVNMLSASRAYEANIRVMQTTKNMAMKALEIGR
jgi:flagellar basal-body rod protein FlgC